MDCRPARCSSSVLAANTSFADFPRLASFHAEDNFMPRQLTKRGHRLVFSNGIIFLAVASIVVLLVTNAKVDALIPLYAIGVFTSFTLSQSGMAKHHLTHREPHWHYGLVRQRRRRGLSLVVDIVIAITKFTHGAWFIIVLVPVMVAGLVRLNRQYEDELEELKQDAPGAAQEPIMRRHVVIVLIDQLDVAAARAIQYARTLTPDDLRAVHFDLDPIKTEDLTNAWRNLGFARLPLDIVECDDRRIPRRPQSSWPRRSPTERPKSACWSHGASTRTSGTGSSTTAPPTRSPKRSPCCRTAT